MVASKRHFHQGRSEIREAHGNLVVPELQRSIDVDLGPFVFPRANVCAVYEFVAVLLGREPKPAVDAVDGDAGPGDGWGKGPFTCPLVAELVAPFRRARPSTAPATDGLGDDCDHHDAKQNQHDYQEYAAVPHIRPLFCAPLWRGMHATESVVVRSMECYESRRPPFTAGLQTMSQEARATVFARRLREVREASGLSQRRLGIAAGLDPFVASTRINRYERGVSWPDVSVILTLAKALGIPAAALLADDPRLAEAIELFGNASKRKQDAALRALR